MSKLPGKGTLLQLGDGGSPSETFTTIADRVQIGGPNMSVGSRETTHLDSDAKEFEPTIPDGGDLTMTLFYDPNETTHQGLTGLVAAPANVHWKLVFNDGMATPANYLLNGHITGFNHTGMEVESNLQAEVTIKLNGLPTINPGAGA